MGLDLWFREDVARILISVETTMLASIKAIALSSDEATAAYQQGFTDAVRAMAIAFGVAVPAEPDNGDRRFISHKNY